MVSLTVLKIKSISAYSSFCLRYIYKPKFIHIHVHLEIPYKTPPHGWGVYLNTCITNIKIVLYGVNYAAESVLFFKNNNNKYMIFKYKISRMPRNYISKKKKKYDNDAMNKAMEAVNSGRLSIRRAADEFLVNRSTLHDTIRKKYQNPGKPGRKQIIPNEVENKISNALIEAARQGVGVSRRQLLRRIGTLSKKLKLQIQTPGKDWFEGFKKRHPDITIRKAEKLTTTRARMLNPQVLNNYFNDLNALMTQLSIHDKPENIWNCDETGKQFEHQPVRVLAEKGAKSVVGRASPGRTNITVMACVSASGKQMPPLFIVKGKTSRSLHGFNTAAAPTGSKWHFQPNGWMTDEIGEMWFSDVFLKECGEARPQLLILDGHSSHESLAILELAIQNDIYIMSLPPHTTHALQPLDRSVFGPLNTAYNNACSDFLNENILHSVNKWSFPGLLASAWQCAVTEKNICSGFKSCGIYPFNPSAVDPQLLKPSKPSDIPVVSNPTPSSLQVQHRIPSATVPLNFCPPRPASSPQVSTPASVTISSTLSVPLSTISISPVSAPQNPDYETYPLSLESESFVTELPSSSSYPPLILLGLISSDNFELSQQDVDNRDGTLEVQSCIWDSAISDLFLPPPPTSTTPRSAPKSRLKSSHRLLTSEEVISEKQKLQVKKEVAEMKKKRKENKQN